MRLYAVGDRRAHARSLRTGLQHAIDDSSQRLADWAPELKATGLVLAVEGWPGGFEIAVQSLDLKHWDIELLNVRGATQQRPELALVYVPYERAHIFFGRLDAYAEKETKGGVPRNATLVQNIRSLRLAALEQLWTDSSPMPDEEGPLWWELWLRRTGEETEALEQVAQRFDWQTAARVVEFPARTVTAVEASKSDLANALSSRLPMAELRRPRLIQTPLELPPEVQRDWATDMARRIRPAGEHAPAVCLLDTGIYRHSLFAGSLGEDDIHFVVGRDGADRDGHGTQLAGLALFGDVEEPLTSSQSVMLGHRLESVKILPDPNAPPNRPETYAAVTAAGVVQPETVKPNRRRVYCFANSRSDYFSGGQPTSWSATIDALASGIDVVSTDRGLELLGHPDPEASRLVVIAAGNVSDEYRVDYENLCDMSPVEDPAQAWNGLTVGAFTELDTVPDHPDFAGYRPVASPGGLSPFSRTSVAFEPRWPMKPDILLEGGNILASPAETSYEWPETVCLTTVSRREPEGSPFASTNATSAAAAQAARLAAMASASYPSLWPETLRGLLVHAAEWTDPMRAAVEATTSKVERRRLVRRYGFGVPTAERVLRSASSSVTLMAQAWIRPFEPATSGTKLREMHFHDLPWPREQLLDLGDEEVRMRVTLSYFIEPNPSSRGWQGRYVYPSHGLRFDVRRSGESSDEFRRRLNRLAELEEGGSPTQGGAGQDWVVGPQGRSIGSLHADLWTGTAADLANSGVLGVFPVGGWWKNNDRHDRTDSPVRYALLVSLHTRAVGVDLYTPIAAQIGIPIPIDR